MMRCTCGWSGRGSSQMPQYREALSAIMVVPNDAMNPPNSASLRSRVMTSVGSSG
jgi:hypothetical protein